MSWGARKLGGLPPIAPSLVVSGDSSEVYSELQQAAHDQLTKLLIKVITAAEEQLESELRALGIELAYPGYKGATRALFFDFLATGARPKLYHRGGDDYAAPTLRQHANRLARSIAARLVQEFQPCTSESSAPKPPSSPP